MRRLSSTGLLLVMLSVEALAQPCPAENYILYSQAEVDAFPSGCTEVTGSLHVRENADIVDLSALAEITSVGANLALYLLPELSDITPLSGITSVGGSLQLNQVHKLADISPLSGVTSVGELLVIDIPVESLDAFSGIHEIPGRMWLSWLHSLTDLTGLGNLSTVGDGVTIETMDSLESLAGLSGLTSVGGFLRLRGLPMLGDLTGLSSLESIGGEFNLYLLNSLENLNGLEQLSEFGGGSVFIQENAALTSFSGIEGAGWTTSHLQIYANPRLEDLSALSAFSSARILTIHDNDALPGLDGLQGLSGQVFSITIQDNASLRNVDALSSISSVEDAIIIEANPALTSITGLTGLDSIGGNLVLNDNDALTDGGEFASLTVSAGAAAPPGLRVVGNKALRRLPRWPEVATIKSLEVSSNDSLFDLSGLETLQAATTSVTIAQNASLVHLDALSSLSSVGAGLWITDNPVLGACSYGLYELVQGTGEIGGAVTMRTNDPAGDCNNNGADLEAGAQPFDPVCPETDYVLLSQATVDAFPQTCSEISGDLTIGPSSDVVDLSPLSQVTTVSGTVTVTGNDALTSLDGLFVAPDVQGRPAGIVALKAAGLVSIGGDLAIQDNPVLTDVDALSSLTGIGGNLLVTGNDVLASCSAGLFALVDGGLVIGSISMSANDAGGDCNSDGADLADVSVGIEQTASERPASYALEAAYPNPFNPSTTIAYSLPEAADVTLSVFDVTGRRVRVLVSETQPAGGYEVMLDASELPSGIYLYRLDAGAYSMTRRVAFVK